MKAGNINQCIANKNKKIQRFSECIVILSRVDSELSFEQCMLYKQHACFQILT